MADYARILCQRGHEVSISYWSGSSANVPAVITRLESEFNLIPHKDRSKLPQVKGMFDSAYLIKSGEIDGLVLPEAHNLVHAVFQNYEPHGSRYAYISKWLAGAMRKQVYGISKRRGNLIQRGQEAVSHGCRNALDFAHLDLVVDVPHPQSGMRSELGIPEDAFVILRFGAQDTFDIPWAIETVVRLLDMYPNWFFVGLNTAPFTDHPRAIYVPMVMDPVEKSSIIAASDVFLTARGQGEAFGVAIAEALQIGIPVLAWNGGNDRNHIEMLKGLNGLYRQPSDLRRRLKQLAEGRDSSSAGARRARGEQFRPSVVAPNLEALLSSNV